MLQNIFNKWALMLHMGRTFLMFFSIFIYLFLVGGLELQTQTATLFDFQKGQPLHLDTSPEFLCWQWSFLYPCQLQCQTKWQTGQSVTPSHLHLHSVQLTAPNNLTLFLVKWQAVCPTEITWTSVHQPYLCSCFKQDGPHMHGQLIGTICDPTEKEKTCDKHENI